MSNFDFAKEYYPNVAKQLNSAEDGFFTQLKESACDIRNAIEELAKHIVFKECGEDLSDTKERFADILSRLEFKVPKDIYFDWKKSYRISSDVAHGKQVGSYKRKLSLKLSFKVLSYCVEVYEDRSLEIPSYVEPYQQNAEAKTIEAVDSKDLIEYCTAIHDDFVKLELPFLIVPNFTTSQRDLGDDGSNYNALSEQYLIVAGSAGTGKTYLTKAIEVIAATVWLCRNDNRELNKLLKADKKHTRAARKIYNQSNQDRWSYLPILFPLREWIKSESLSSQLMDVLRWKGVNISSEILFEEQLLKTGRCLIILDGVDEISNDALEIAESSIKRLISKYPQNRYVVTSREELPASYRGSKNNVRLTQVTLQSLDEKGGNLLLRRLSGEKKISISKFIEDSSTIDATPLNVVILFEVGKEAKNESDLYLRYIDSRIERELKNKTTPFEKVETVRSICSGLAYEMLRRGQSEVATLSPKRITQEQAEEFLAQVDYIHPYLAKSSKEISSSAKNRILRNCKTLFNKAYEWHYIRSNPFSKIGQTDAGEQPWHYFSPEQFNSILSRANSIKTKGLYAIMFGCGLRLGEAINILDNGTDIDFENNRVNVVNRQGSKDIPVFSIKDKHIRSVSIPNWVSKILIEVQGSSEEHCPFVFLSKNRYELVMKNWHRYMSEGITSKWKNKDVANNILRDFKVKVRHAGIKVTDKVTIHCLRKSWASNLANAGVPPHTLMKMGGWSNIETVLKYYIKTSDENEKKAVRILDELMERESENRVEVGEKGGRE